MHAGVDAELARQQTQAALNRTERSVYFGNIAQARSQWLLNNIRASAQLFEVPVSLVFLLAQDEPFWPDRLGLDKRKSPLLGGFLKEAVGDDDLIVTDDVLEEKRLAQSAFVRERGVRRLVAVVLRAEAGNIVGYLCLVDTKPGATTGEQKEIIATIGRELVEAVSTLHRSETVPH